MAVVHVWLKEKKEKKSKSKTNNLVGFVMNLWKHARLLMAPSSTGSALRFEDVMAYWCALFLQCCKIGKCDRLRLVSTPCERDESYPVLFPEFSIYMLQKKKLPTFSIPASEFIKIHSLPNHLSTLMETAAGVSHSTQTNPGTVFKCCAGEPAVDVIMWLDSTLFMIQCRNLGRAMPRNDLKKDLEYLCRLRGELWIIEDGDEEEKSTTSPKLYQKIGLPKISEEQVVYVLAAPLGLEGKYKKTDPSTGDHVRKLCEDLKFQGLLALPGNQKQLLKLNETDEQEYETWLDPMMGPTFKALVHALILQPK